MPPDVRLAIELLEQPIDHIRERCRMWHDTWKQRAIDLMPKTLDELATVEDDGVRSLFTRRINRDQLALGQFIHLALWWESHHAAGSTDETLLTSLKQTRPILPKGSTHDMDPTI